MESVLPYSTMAVAVFTVPEVGLFFTLKIWIILFSHPYKVLDFMDWHQAHDHTEDFPTLSTQYQTLMMIDGSAIGFKLDLLLLLLNVRAFKTARAYHK